MHMYRMTVQETPMELLCGIIKARRIATGFRGSASNYHWVPWKRVDLPANVSSHIEFRKIAKHHFEELS